MPNNEIINNMVQNAVDGSKEAMLYLIKYYQSVVYNIISSFDITEDQEDFIEEGINAILCAIYTYDFKNFSFDSYVRKTIDIKLSALINEYYDYTYSNNITSLPNRLNGENIYESVDSILEIGDSLDRAVVCDGEKSSVGESFISSSSDTESEAINNILKDELGKMLEELFIKSGLLNLEISILKYYFGFYGGCFTVEQIGDELLISTQDVESILDEAILKLKKCEAVKKFSGYMENPEVALDYVAYFQTGSFGDDEEDYEPVNNVSLLKKLIDNY